MRPLISYDDIVAPEPTPRTNPPPVPPPAKKRRTNQNQNQNQHQHRQGYAGGGRAHQQHWDDPGSQEPPMMYDDAPAPSAGSSARHAEYHEEEGEADEDESRELTQDEIWDDSALIDAWNSAAAEYEAFHGKGKSWKDEPVKKSPLWYNVPPATTSKPKAGPSGASNGAATNADSTPLNFDTFVPVHDPSLAAGGSAIPAPTMDGAAALGVGAEAAMVSQDEAFTRAMTAMYWSGYWTAVYHTRRNEAQVGAAAVQENGGEEEDAVEDGEAEDEEMLPAQR
ncbi:uncharacterized protein TRAVEDRAFT_140676 [Trametes versicolor FP-101664 SS1]|uniref:uncharacterized protein n=1 Tax=Trametes versicolor (strain FP-101664) TaxID=717944 RepID=UPI00046219B2|nr:uncharacterized protein TRAVEDRAFT_140676 [Trametes versicolor FP-101664 SS1]EIW65254.1 hypothetical protein TRAVEDRAFT_140676 [Trametes versicolor FP-101664 SS1]